MTSAVTSPRAGSAIELARWLGTLDRVRIERIGTVAIGRAILPAVEYVQTRGHLDSSRAYAEGQRTYEMRCVYVLGRLPASYARRAVYRFAGDSRDWYVGGYFPSEQGTPGDELANEYHPFGRMFQLMPWDVPTGEAIDAWDEHKRLRMLARFMPSVGGGSDASPSDQCGAPVYRLDNPRMLRQDTCAWTDGTPHSAHNSKGAVRSGEIGAPSAEYRAKHAECRHAWGECAHDLYWSYASHTGNPLLPIVAALAALMEGQRQTLIGWLASNDRNGSYRDDQSRNEFGRPLTLSEAKAAAREALDPSQTGEALPEYVRGVRIIEDSAESETGEGETQAMEWASFEGVDIESVRSGPLDTAALQSEWDGTAQRNTADWHLFGRVDGADCAITGLCDRPAGHFGRCMRAYEMADYVDAARQHREQVDAFLRHRVPLARRLGVTVDGFSTGDVDPYGEMPAFAWPGGYLIAYYTNSGDVLCADCVNAETLGESDPATMAEALEGDYAEDYGMDAVPLCAGCNRPLDPADRGPHEGVDETPEAEARALAEPLSAAETAEMESESVGENGR